MVGNNTAGEGCIQQLRMFCDSMNRSAAYKTSLPRGGRLRKTYLQGICTSRSYQSQHIIKVWEDTRKRQHHRHCNGMPPFNEQKCSLQDIITQRRQTEENIPSRDMYKSVLSKSAYNKGVGRYT